MKKLLPFLEHKAYNIRRWSLIQTSEAGSGHPTSCLSAADIVAALFFYAMRYNPRYYNDHHNDRFILSKGHAAPVLYAAWKEVGVLSEDDLLSYRRIDSVLEGHPTLRFPYAEAATGSLGIGLSIGAGEALCAKLDKRDYRVYVLLGDSEMSEGSVWEAIQIAAHYKLNNLIGIIDCNGLGQSTEIMFDHDVNKFARAIEAFGWKTFTIDGHDMKQITHALDQARAVKNVPSMIIAKTFKGYGITQAQSKEGFHGKAFKREELDVVLVELEKKFPKAAAYKETKRWQPRLPKESEHEVQIDRVQIKLPDPTYEQGKPIPTRKAYGQALTALGGICDAVVSLDAEVKNSTFAELFEQKFPDRFFQCFVAEQNMISMAVGFNRRGKMPFASTFGCFMSRAYDQIRMAAIGQSTIHLVGSHAGVSIGEDGPSQMALEDIALMRALPESIVLYPSDAVSTWKLVEQMAKYDKGISYLRTTRGPTPVIYKSDEKFPIGGCKVLRQDKRDKVCVIAAGITLFEALAAYEILAFKDKPIFISIIDLYSIKPLDAGLLTKVAKASGNNIITVEDHYSEGGLGEAVTAALCNEEIHIERLAVNKLPRSGKPEELLAYVGIDREAIVKKVLELV